MEEDETPEGFVSLVLREVEGEATIDVIHLMAGAEPLVSFSDFHFHQGF